MKPLKLLIPLLAVMLCCSCDDGALELDERTASVRFEQPRVEIEQSSDVQVPLVLLASKGSVLKAYTVYVEVDDPQAWIGNVCTIANPVYKAADPASGDHRTIYTAVVGEGMLKAGLLITAGVHSSEDIDRELTFRIVSDPLQAAYPGGNLYYQPGSDDSVSVLLRKMES